MIVALLTAAGIGSRMHRDIPKQFIHVENKPVIIHTMEAFQRHPAIDAILCVTIDSWMDVLWAYARLFDISKLKWVVSGGKTGQDSIFNGLKKLKKEFPDDENITIMVHDGNRPLVSDQVISGSIATCKRFGSAVAAIPCAEVVFESEDGICSTATIEREKLWRTQTPHTYALRELYAAHLQAQQRGIEGTAASCLLMQKLGYPTYFSIGSEENLKITTQDDLKIFKALLSMNRENRM